MPVVVENDGNAAAFAEATVGAGSGADPVLVVVVGTGIGGGFVSGGRIMQGAHPQAGNIGHTDVAGAGCALCPCGGRGHIEAVASAWAVEHDHVARAGPHRVPYAEIARRADAGDSVALDVLEVAGRRLATWLPSMTAVLDPEIVIIGGGATRAAAYWNAFMGGVAHGDVDVRRSLLGEDAVAIGAAALARAQDQEAR